jgi:hypothetical protein
LLNWSQLWFHIDCWDLKVFFFIQLALPISPNPMWDFVLGFLRPGREREHTDFRSVKPS